MKTKLIRRLRKTGIFGLIPAFSMLQALGAGLLAQSPAEISGFVLVNCVASDQPITASFSGRSVLAEPGLAAGRATSGLGVPTGSGLLQVSHPAFEGGEISLDIVKGTTPIVVVYPEANPANAGGKPKLALRQTQSNQSTDAAFSVVFAAGREVPSFSGTANGQPVQLQPWRPQKIQGASIRLETSGDEIFSATQEQPEAWYVFVSPKQDGGFLTVGVPQVIYEW